MQHTWWAGTGRFAKVLSAAFLVTSLALTGCGKNPTAGSTPTPASTAETDPTDGPGQPDPTQAPTEPPEGEQFTFDQAARWDDGLTVEVASIKKAKAGDHQRGAEGTEGDIVIAEILVTNDTAKQYDTAALKVSGYYGVVGAPKIVDATGALGDSFQGTIAPGGRAKATMGWAIPADAMEEVTIMIDGNSPQHGRLRFTGPVS